MGAPVDRKRSSGHMRIGISGWTYPGWRGTFYPPSLPHRAEMDYAASRFHTIEINGSFYSLQRAASFRSWYERSADDFVFAIKGSRFITHMLQLNDSEQALANFFAQGILELGSKLGPILWQFSPRFRFRPEKLEPFVSMLPRTHAAAAALAADHDHRVKDPSTPLARRTAASATPSRSATRASSCPSSSRCFGNATPPSSSRAPPTSTRSSRSPPPSGFVRFAQAVDHRSLSCSRRCRFPRRLGTDRGRRRAHPCHRAPDTTPTPWCSCVGTRPQLDRRCRR
jgi:hypothetical protein